MRRFLVPAGVVVLLAAFAPGAQAGSFETTDCLGLQDALDNATTGGTVSLSEMCTAGNSGASNGAFTLPSNAITLQGEPGAGFDGTGVSPRPLTGSDVADTTIKDLTFRDGSGNGGGAVLLDGNSTPTFDSVRFEDNQSAGPGGAVFIDTTATGAAPVRFIDSTFTGNGSPTSNGGAIAIGNSNLGAPVEIKDSEFLTNDASYGGALYAFAYGSDLSLENNTFEGNTAVNQGGGVYAFTLNVTMGGNHFASNELDNTANPGGVGGGMVAYSLGLGSTFNSSGNVFDANEISFNPIGQSFASGAGLQTFGFDSHFDGDRFINNVLQGPNATAGSESEGSGLSVTACAGVNPPTDAKQIVVAGNTIGGGDDADGALYIGCATGDAHLRIYNSTISGNAGGPGSTAGIWGGSSDKLELYNTIVAGNTGGPDLIGFQSVTAQFSDLCIGGGAFPGTGNICADPKLIAPGPDSADVRQTDTSPTIDAGSNALIPVGVTTDLFGDPRIIDALGNGPVVDMGVHEHGALPKPPAPPSPPAPPTNEPSGSDLKLTIPSGGKLGSTLPVNIRCAIKFAGSCEGDLTAGALLTIRGKAISSKKRKPKARKVKLRLGSVKFAVGKDQTRTVKLKISTKNRKKLAKLRSVRVELSGSFHVGPSKTVSAKTTLRYKVAKAKKKQKRP